jgi:cytochrome P450
MTPETAYAEAMKFENRANPYPFFDELRKTPVARVADGLYVVTGYPELLALAHDPRVSSHMAPLGDRGKAEPAHQSTEAYGDSSSMIGQDPPVHDRMRRQAMRQFGPPHAPDVIPKMEPECQRIVNGLLDKAKGKTRIDLVDDYAHPLPVTIICKMMNLPLADEPRFQAWVDDAMAGVDLGPEAATPEGQARSKKGNAAIAAFKQYMTAWVGRLAREPGGEGMIAKMLHDKGPDGPMSPADALANAMLLFLAGHDSTVNLISHCVLTALRNPGSVELLRDRRELIPGAIEEVLRLQSSVQFFPSRSATADIEVGGTTIPKGAKVFLMYGAANRDPRRFPNANEFDPARKDNEHFGWGSGLHTCFGGPLARLEVNTAFEVFLRRVENPRLVTDPPPYRRNQIFRGPRHLLIDFDRIRD